MEVEQRGFAMAVNPTFLLSWSFTKAPQAPVARSSSSAVTSEVSE